jgi:predicted Zn-dependent peptidase
VLTALAGELASLRDGAADAAEDFVRARRRAYAQQLADAAGASDLGLELDFVASNDLPVAYFAKLAEKVAAVTPEDVAVLAKTDLAERRMVVVVAGRAPVVTGAFAAAGITAEMLDAQ